MSRTCHAPPQPERAKVTGHRRTTVGCPRFARTLGPDIPVLRFALPPRWYIYARPLRRTRAITSYLLRRHTRIGHAEALGLDVEPKSS
jgi:hypothetical protein